MTTITQRLREIADTTEQYSDRHSRWVAENLRAIAAELEAPAADAPKIVAWEYARRYGSGVSFARPDDYTDEDGYLVTPTPLIRQRDHLATVSALQARINALEARQWRQLTDEDRTRAIESLPDMLDGFMKTWGWLHFAKAIEAICREKNEQQDSSKERP